MWELIVVSKDNGYIGYRPLTYEKATLKGACFLVKDPTLKVILRRIK
jgi:hypothetical protein